MPQQLLLLPLLFCCGEAANSSVCMQQQIHNREEGTKETLPVHASECSPIEPLGFWRATAPIAAATAAEQKLLRELLNQVVEIATTLLQHIPTHLHAQVRCCCGCMHATSAQQHTGYMGPSAAQGALHVEGTTWVLLLLLVLLLYWLLLVLHLLLLLDLLLPLMLFSAASGEGAAAFWGPAALLRPAELVREAAPGGDSCCSAAAAACALLLLGGEASARP